MVAFNSTRRRANRQAACAIIPLASPICLAKGEIPAESASMGASRRSAAGVGVVRNARGDVTSVRIGRWRTLHAAPGRSIIDVRELACGRVAVRILHDGGSGRSSNYEIWQLYAQSGRLLASLQTSVDGSFALVSDYQSHQALRLQRNRQGEMETIESWTI